MYTAHRQHVMTFTQTTPVRAHDQPHRYTFCGPIYTYIWLGSPTNQKSANAMLLKNYRPVSVLPILSKILEKLGQSIALLHLLIDIASCISINVGLGQNIVLVVRLLYF